MELLNLLDELDEQERQLARIREIRAAWAAAAAPKPEPEPEPEEDKCEFCDKEARKDEACCKYCADCCAYLPAGDWDEVCWIYTEEIGDICPRCSDKWWECEKCQTYWSTDDQDFDEEDDEHLCPECRAK